MRYSPTLETFAACVSCGIPQPREHFPTKVRSGRTQTRSTCAPCRTAIDTLLKHVDWRQGAYACLTCGGIQSPPFIPNQCTECGFAVRDQGTIKIPARNGKAIPLPELRVMYHRNRLIGIMQAVVAEIGLDDTTAVFNRYRPLAMRRCPCENITDASPSSPPPQIPRCPGTMDFWECVAVLTGEL